MKPSVYIRDDYIRRDGTSALFIKVYISGAYVKIPLKIYVKPEFFNSHLQVITGGENSRQYNLRIKDALGKASRIILKYEFNNKQLTRDIFVKEYSNPTVFVDFYQFMNTEIKERFDITEGTRKHHYTTLNKMMQFRANLMISELDDNYLREYYRYWKKGGNSKNTLHADFKIIKVYVNKAIALELIAKSPFKAFRAPKENILPVFLDPDELTRMMELYDSNKLPDTYKCSLRQFLFMCFTGIRVSDLKTICFEDIRGNVLRFKPVKSKNTTQNQVDIPLLKYAWRLIGDQQPDKNKRYGEIFSKYAAQQLNKNLKEICAAAKIKKKITCHSGRHTFATNFLRKSKLANGILILQKLLGHAKLESTMVYSHVLIDDIERAMMDMET